MKILLAVDGSEYTKKMLAYLATHPELIGTQHSFVALTVQAPLPPRARAALGKSDCDAYYAEESQQVLKPVLAFLAQRGIEAIPDFRVGAAGECIAQAANEGRFDLLVMGSHGHSALGTLVMGSVTTQVLAHCKVPVLLVR